MIKLTNPQDGKVHEMNKDAFDELRKAHQEAVEYDRDEVVFRAMRLDLTTVKSILAADL